MALKETDKLDELLDKARSKGVGRYGSFVPVRLYIMYMSRCFNCVKMRLQQIAEP